MADTFYLTKGDLLPVLTATMLGATGSPINLASASSVTFQMWPAADLPNSTTFTIKSPCSLANAGAGVVTYAWQGTDTATAGIYYCNFVINWPGGATQTVPSPGHDSVIIRDVQS